MGNLLTNAAFLDGTDGWTKSAQLALSVDETLRGAPGRAVLLASGASTAANQTLSLGCADNARAVVTAGTDYEVSCGVLALVDGATVAPTAELVWRTTGGAVVATAPLPLRPAIVVSQGEGYRGVPRSFRSVRTRLTAPATAARAELRLSVVPAASGAAATLGLLKPQIAAVPPQRTDPLTFDPGSHGSVDLRLPAWPVALRPVDLGPGAQPLPNALEFAGQAPGRPISRRLSSSPARKFEASVRCDPAERDLLEAFAATVGDFWFVEPDSDRLCVAKFAADGQPRMTEDKGVVSTIGFSLWLETA